MKKQTAVIEAIVPTKNPDYMQLYFEAYRREDNVVVIPEKKLVMTSTVARLSLVVGDVVEL